MVGSKTPAIYIYGIGITSYIDINFGLRQTVRRTQTQENEEYKPPPLPNDREKHVVSYGFVTVTYYTTPRLDLTRYGHPSNLQGGLKFLGES